MQRGVVRRSNQVFTEFLRIPVELYHFCATQNICGAKVFLDKKVHFQGTYSICLKIMFWFWRQNHQSVGSESLFNIVTYYLQLGLCPCISHLPSFEGFNNRPAQTLEERRGKAILNEGGDFLHIPSIRQSHVWAHVNFEITHSSGIT